MPTKVRASINQLIPFSIVDGPGNRTAIFTQGCNYRCGYCHNPETINPCIHCGICVPHCPEKAIYLNDKHKIVFLPDLCKRCDRCIEVCPHLSCPRLLNWTAEETFAFIKTQMPFIEGITVSGGECTLHQEWLTELFLLCKKEGLTTFIDSNGSFPFSRHPILTSLTDAVMLDWKGHLASGMQEACNINYSEDDWQDFLNEVHFLAQKGKLFEIRTVIVDNFFNTSTCVKLAAQTISAYQQEQPYAPRYKLITYRQNGVRPPFRATYKSPSKINMEKLRQLALDCGVNEVIIL